MNDKLRELEKAAIQDIMKTEGGRHFMWRCLEQSCIFMETFNSDPSIHALNAGRRNNGLWIESELKDAAPANYIKMLQEHIDE